MYSVEMFVVLVGLILAILPWLIVLKLLEDIRILEIELSSLKVKDKISDIRCWIENKAKEQKRN